MVATRSRRLGRFADSLDANGKITGLETTLNGLATDISSKQDALGFTPENAAQKNQPNGYAGLDAAGKLPPGVVASRIVLETFTASGTFTKEADDIAYWIVIIGGGNGGNRGSTSSSSSALGGNGGAFNELFLEADQVGETESVIIGAGGAGGTSSASAGAAGGFSAFGPHRTPEPTQAGVGASNASYVATVSGMSLSYESSDFPTGNKYTAPGGHSRNTTSRPGGLPSTTATGAAPAGANATVPGGGGGAGVYTSGKGGDGMAPGGGGGAGGYHSSAPGDGGNGARGEVRVYRLKK